MRPFDGRTILLGVTGGIASYKSAWLARLLTKAGARVDAVLTRSATEFISALTFEALTGRAAHTGLFDSGRALDHIALARSAEAIVVAPATADFMARAATGQADDLLTAVLLATHAPVLLVPAMNDRMWAHPQTQRNVEHLRGLGYHLLEPEEGELAAGEGEGPGRMPEPETIFAHVGRLLERSGGSTLAGRRVLVTAGPTREAIDPVRFVSNHSSGKMGVALASAAWRRGATVDLIAGPLSIAVPSGPQLRHVETTAEMAEAVHELVPNPDILATLSRPGPQRPALVVGFAAETENLVANAIDKRQRKGCDWIVANDVSPAVGTFGGERNTVHLITASGVEDWPTLAKGEVAMRLAGRIALHFGQPTKAEAAE